jgi:hypothetical protein
MDMRARRDGRLLGLILKFQAVSSLDRARQPNRGAASLTQSILHFSVVRIQPTDHSQAIIKCHPRVKPKARVCVKWCRGIFIINMQTISAPRGTKGRSAEVFMYINMLGASKNAPSD